ncbi:MAG: hypothetical protein ACKO85_18020, partial [Isosphaeraceae bacterium]
PDGGRRTGRGNVTGRGRDGGAVRRFSRHPRRVRQQPAARAGTRDPPRGPDRRAARVAGHIDKVTLLFDPTTPTTAFDKLSVSIYNEVIVGGTEQPGTSQVNYDKKVSVGSLITLGNKEFRP